MGLQKPFGAKHFLVINKFWAHKNFWSQKYLDTLWKYYARFFFKRIADILLSALCAHSGTRLVEVSCFFPIASSHYGIIKLVLYLIYQFIKVCRIIGLVIPPISVCSSYYKHIWMNSLAALRGSEWCPNDPIKHNERLQDWILSDWCIFDILFNLIKGLQMT